VYLAASFDYAQSHLNSKISSIQSPGDPLDIRNWSSLTLVCLIVYFKDSKN